MSPRGEAAMLYGARSIARFLGISVRQAYHLTEIDQIPTFKVGTVVCAQSDALRAWLSDRAPGGRRAPGAVQRADAGDPSPGRPAEPPQPRSAPAQVPPPSAAATADPE